MENFERLKLEKNKNETVGMGVGLLLVGLAIYLLIKYPFAAIVFLISVGALIAAYSVQSVVWSGRWKLVAGFFGLVFVLHLIKLSSSDVAEKKQEVLSPEEQRLRQMASDKDMAYRYLKRINRHTEVAISPVEAANCLMAIDRADRGVTDWTTAKDKCLDAATNVDSIR